MSAFISCETYLLNRDKFFRGLAARNSKRPCKLIGNHAQLYLNVQKILLLMICCYWQFSPQIRIHISYARFLVKS